MLNNQKPLHLDSHLLYKSSKSLFTSFDNFPMLSDELLIDNTGQINMAEAETENTPNSSTSYYKKLSLELSIKSSEIFKADAAESGNAPLASLSMPSLYSSPGRQGQSKPSISYIALIAKSILESPDQKLNLGSIYEWIETRFEYFKSQGQGWRNSVRHNLSLNDCFIKVGRCEDGKGNYWGIHPSNLAAFQLGDFRQRRKSRRSRCRKVPKEWSEYVGISSGPHNCFPSAGYAYRNTNSPPDCSLSPEHACRASMPAFQEPYKRPAAYPQQDYQWRCSNLPPQVMGSTSAFTNEYQYDPRQCSDHSNCVDHSYNNHGYQAVFETQQTQYHCYSNQSSYICPVHVGHPEYFTYAN